MKKLLMRNFYIMLVGAFSMLSGIIIGALWLFYHYPGFNLMISYRNDLSILTLNSILVVLGIFTIAASLYYYTESTKEENSDVGSSTIEQHTEGN
jgi:membrane-bound ClpP family serine protease